MAGETARNEVALDSSLLILADRGARTFANVQAALAEERTVGVVAIPALAEVWRDGARQSQLPHALKAMALVDCTEGIAKRAGELLALAGGKNTMDAIVVSTAEARACGVITGDLKDLRALASQARGVTVDAP